MAAVIGIHTVMAYGARLERPSAQETFYYLEQPLKFGTIGFFLIAGFLFGERMDHISPFRYFCRRLQNVFMPWCVWFLMWCGMTVCMDIKNDRVTGFDLEYGIQIIKGCLFGSAFWFVPNLLIALAILLVFRRQLNDLRFGLIFLLATAFYTANIYGRWIPGTHTSSMFGFVFYLWLGAWGVWHFPAVKKHLARFSVSAMIGLVLLTFCLSIAETKLLVTLHSTDPANTLRISNQIFSLLVVLALLKIQRAVWPPVVNVRDHTYGLYLLHSASTSLLGKSISPLIRFLGTAPWWAFAVGTAALLPLLYASVYGSCLLVVRILLATPKLRWTVGLAARKSQMDRSRRSDVPQNAIPDANVRALSQL